MPKNMPMIQIVLPCAVDSTVYLVQGSLEYSEAKRKVVYAEHIVKAKVVEFHVRRENRVTADIRTEGGEQRRNVVCGKDYYTSYNDAAANLINKKGLR